MSINGNVIRHQIDKNSKLINNKAKSVQVIFFGEVLPKFPTSLLTKKEISKIIDDVYRHCGQKDTVIFCDHIMKLGFKNAFKAGISFGKDDMIIPEEKEKMIEETHALATEFEQQYIDGFITRGEKYNKVVDAWAKCTDRVENKMME